MDIKSKRNHWCIKKLEIIKFTVSRNFNFFHSFFKHFEAICCALTLACPQKALLTPRAHSHIHQLTNQRVHHKSSANITNFCFSLRCVDSATKSFLLATSCHHCCCCHTKHTTDTRALSQWSQSSHWMAAWSPGCLPRLTGWILYFSAKILWCANLLHLPDQRQHRHLIPRTTTNWGGVHTVKRACDHSCHSGWQTELILGTQPCDNSLGATPNSCNQATALGHSGLNQWTCGLENCYDATIYRRLLLPWW